MRDRFHESLKKENKVLKLVKNGDLQGLRIFVEREKITFNFLASIIAIEYNRMDIVNYMLECEKGSTAFDIHVFEYLISENKINYIELITTYFKEHIGKYDKRNFYGMFENIINYLTESDNSNPCCTLTPLYSEGEKIKLVHLFLEMWELYTLPKLK